MSPVKNGLRKARWFGMARKVTLEEAVVLVRQQMGGKLSNNIEIDADTQLASLNLSSLDLTEVFFGLEELAGELLDPVAAVDVTTVGGIVQAINGQIGSSTATEVLA